MRSNKLMYDRNTDTVWNAITGEPAFGPLDNKWRGAGCAACGRHRLDELARTTSRHQRAQHGYRIPPELYQWRSLQRLLQ